MESDRTPLAVGLTKWTNEVDEAFVDGAGTSPY